MKMMIGDWVGIQPERVEDECGIQCCKSPGNDVQSCDDSALLTVVVDVVARVLVENHE